MKRDYICDYLKEFCNTIPVKKLLFNRQMIDTDSLIGYRDRLHFLALEGVMVEPMQINEKCMRNYIYAQSLLVALPEEYKLYNLLEDYLRAEFLSNNQFKIRNILLDIRLDKNDMIQDVYDKMIAHYLLDGNIDPVHRFSDITDHLNNIGANVDLAESIMKYGNALATKLETIISNESKNRLQIETFSEQAIHTFSTAENIGNRSVNAHQHTIWERRLISLRLLEEPLSHDMNLPSELMQYEDEELILDTDTMTEKITSSVGKKHFSPMRSNNGLIGRQTTAYTNNYNNQTFDNQ
ncbi:MAG: hypothetical protein ACLRFL_03580 [Clostridia bacterium]